MKDPLISSLTEYKESWKYDTTYLTHSIHPYSGKFIPQLPRLIIKEHTNERNTILDPFCGSGTTILEACILGRKSIGIDSNPIATLISMAKTTYLDPDDIHKIELLIEYFNNENLIPEADFDNIPKIPNINHWFQDNVIKELSFIKKVIGQFEKEKLKTFLKCIFSSIIVTASNQESETRYAAKNKNIKDGFTINRFANKLYKELQNIKELSYLKTVQRNIPRIYTLDIRYLPSSSIKENSVDLVVTSPPYPNSYDYYLYHKLRMYWMGFDFNKVKEIEIGSRNEHSSRKAPIDSFVYKMVPAFKNVARLLKPSKLAYFFVGDSIISGKLINMSQVINDIAKKANLRFIGENEYSLDEISRSFHEKRHSVNRNIFKKMQRFIVFEGTAVSKSNYYFDNREIARPKSSIEQTDLDSEIIDGSIIAINSKDSERHIHSLGKYPSKFIPEIPRWALNDFTNPGNDILDPFCGAGTVAVEALIHSRNVISADISPYACLLTEGKTTRASKERIVESLIKIMQVLDNPDRLPNSGRMYFDYDSFWFNLDYLFQIEAIRNYILGNIPKNLQKFFLSVLSLAIKPCSYLDESQLKVKRDPKKILHGTPSPIDLMKGFLFKWSERLIQFNEIASKNEKSTIINDSAENLSGNHVKENSIDMIITSPPYINSMNYPMTHRYENILLGLIRHQDNISHQMSYYGTERVYSKDYSILHSVDSSYTYADYLNPLLRQIYKSEPKRSFIAYKYFEDMRRALHSLVKLLKKGGIFIIVVGDNTIRGVRIETYNILKQIMAEMGMNQKKSFYYEIIKQSFKLRRHETASLIKMDCVIIMEKI